MGDEEVGEDEGKAGTVAEWCGGTGEIVWDGLSGTGSDEG